jgi:hypothetical protein
MGTATCGFCETSVVVELEAPVAKAAADDGSTKLPCPRCGVSLFETRVGDSTAAASAAESGSTTRDRTILSVVGGSPAGMSANMAIPSLQPEPA